VSEADRAHAREALVTLRRRVDAHFTRAATAQPEQFQCHLGCDGCCAPGLSVFGIEAETIREALATMQRDNPALRQLLRQQAHGAADRDRCTLLVAGRCAVYEARPLICRSHGVAARDPDGQLTHCPLNFTTAPPRADAVLDLDALNRPLAVMAHIYDAGQRVTLTELARQPST
jgi:Fe-S-cluster containining protein